MLVFSLEVVRVASDRRRKKPRALTGIPDLRGCLQKTSSPLSLFLSIAGSDVREVGKGPKGYGQDKPPRQREDVGSQIAVT